MKTRKASEPKPDPIAVLCAEPGCSSRAQVKLSGFPSCEAHLEAIMSRHASATITPIKGAPDAQRIMTSLMQELLQ